MFNCCVRSGAAAGRAIWLATALCLTPFAAMAQSNEAIPVELDQARLIKLPERAATVVIGNPLIADVSIQPGGLAVVTGKGYGTTNVILLDKTGAVLAEHGIVVRGPADPIVVVYRGDVRETYSCAPECLPRITLGDDSDFFNQTLNQATTRNNQAMAVGTPPIPGGSSAAGSIGTAGPGVVGGGGVTIITVGGPGAATKR